MFSLLIHHDYMKISQTGLTCYCLYSLTLLNSLLCLLQYFRVNKNIFPCLLCRHFTRTQECKYWGDKRVEGSGAVCRAIFKSRAVYRVVCNIRAVCKLLNTCDPFMQLFNTSLWLAQLFDKLKLFAKFTLFMRLFANSKQWIELIARLP